MSAALQTTLMQNMNAAALTVIIREGTRDMDMKVGGAATATVVKGAWAQLKKTAPAVHSSLKACVAAGIPLYK